MTDAAPAPTASASSVDDLPRVPAINRLLAVMARLRDPAAGCPWDVAQSFETIAPYTIEEAYEVADAIATGDREALKDELGDLLLQVVYHAQMADEEGSFDFEAVAAAIAEKMIRRHPHVFAGAEIVDADAWETHKAEERAARVAAEGGPVSALDGIAAAYPALMRALKLQKRAGRVGFDWPEPTDVLAKLDEEVQELRAEIERPGGRDATRIEDEIGDLLFTIANLARHLGVDPETALRRSNTKFERRFRAMEAGLADEGKPLVDATLGEMERHWRRIKLSEHYNNQP